MSTGTEGLTKFCVCGVYAGSAEQLCCGRDGIWAGWAIILTSSCLNSTASCCVSGFGEFFQNFFQPKNATTARIIVAPNMTAGEVNCQWSAENGFWTVSKCLSKWLASKSPWIDFLRSFIIAVRCSLWSWLKSWASDIVQSSQEFRIWWSSESSAEIKWSMVGMLHPCLTVTVCPDLMVGGERELSLGQTWFVAMVPIE